VSKSKSNARTRARRLALQGLYEWQLSSNKPSDIEIQYLVEKDTANVDVAYFRELLTRVPVLVEELDASIAALLSRPLEEVDPVERTALRLGAYELLHHPEVPYRVIINESVELVKMFGAEQGYRFVNGILDRLATEQRSVEVSARAKKKEK